MIKLNDISKVYFVGIGGIGMSAIARFFLQRGVSVSGYDKTETPLTQRLASEGAHIHYTDDVALIDQNAQIVIYTPAIPKTHSELNWLTDHGYPILKRSDVLQIITAETFNICVAGTHGKTSISTMVAHLLRHTGYGCTAFLGGVSVNYGTNFWSGNPSVCVVEADEYDRSFHKLTPDIAVVTSMDADHLDIYGTEQAMQDAFVHFATLVKPGGLLIRKQGLLRLNEAFVKRQLVYALQASEATKHHHHHHDEDEIPDVYATNLQTITGGYRFDAVIAGRTIQQLELHVGGLHNVENMLVAITVATWLNIEESKIKAAVAAFEGVKRRFEYLIQATKANGQPLVMIDDYAHHPEELRALITSAKHLFPNLRCKMVFQPHLFSRTKDHATAFGEVLSLADEVVLLPIYPARELPMPSVSAALIAESIPVGKVTLMEKADWLETLDAKNTELLITAGAGDIDALLPEAKKRLLESIE